MNKKDKYWGYEQTIQHITSKGIYKITCEVNGRYYIGRSHRIEVRWAEHENALLKMKYEGKKNDAGKQKMQDDYLKFGFHSLSKTIIYRAENIHLQRSLEEYLIKTFNPEYNSVFAKKGEVQKEFDLKAAYDFVKKYLPLEMVALVTGKKYDIGALWNRLVILKAVECHSKESFLSMIEKEYKSLFLIDGSFLIKK